MGLLYYSQTFYNNLWNQFVFHKSNIKSYWSANNLKFYKTSVVNEVSFVVHYLYNGSTVNKISIELEKKIKVQYTNINMLVLCKFYFCPTLFYYSCFILIKTQQYIIGTI